MKRILTGSVALNIVLLLAMALRVSLAEHQGSGGVAPSRNGDVNGDGSLDLSDAVYILSHLFRGGPSPREIVGARSPQLPATGQSLCYDLTGNVIDCVDESHPGQDGFYQAGCPMEDRFHDNTDGTITDECTGLVWQRDTPAGTFNWQQGLDYCHRLELGGHDDWRLPNVLEILSIQHYGRLAPSMDQVFGPAGDLYWYWSSSTAQDLPGWGWIVSFGVGIAKGWPKSDAYHIRAVRGGVTAR